MRSAGGEIVRVCGSQVAEKRPLTTAPYHVAAPDDLQGLMERDLEAWKAARAVIARAKRA